MLFQWRLSPNCWEIDFAKLCIWRINAGDIAAVTIYNFSKPLPCFRNTRSNTTSAFLWVVNESTHVNGGFVAAFQTIAPVLLYGLCCVAVNHLLSAGALCQRGDEHQHSPPLQFLSCWRFYLGRSPDAAACLSTSSSRSVLACWLRLFIFGSDDTYSYNSFQWRSAVGVASNKPAAKITL